MKHLPLFPLNAVLFPNAPLPLHIFEERYQLLVSRCIENEQPFGIVYHRGEKLEQIGCTAQVDRVLKRYEDGRLDIVTIGRRRFSIESIDNSEPYPQGLVRFLDDDGAHDGPGVDELLTAAMDALLQYAYYSELEIDRDGMHELTASELSYLIAGIEDMGLETKQKLLEMDNPVRRLNESVIALDGVNKQLLSLMTLKKATGTEVDLGTLKN